MSRPITLVTEPTVEVIAEMELSNHGILEMADWVRTHRPDCVPDGEFDSVTDLLPHAGVEEAGLAGRRYITDNELLVELAGRKCYDSFAEKAGKKTNKEYILHTQQGAVPHRSIMYHAKMTFFIAGVSRRVSHELIRNYVGADRTEEGSPSQESTRFTEHYGHFIIPPKILDQPEKIETFRRTMQAAYDSYLGFIRDEVSEFERKTGAQPKGMDRKRIYEAASFYLPHSVETSFIWTTNPVALEKLFKERCDEAADAEFRRFALAWRLLCYSRWPNLFSGASR